MSQPNNPPSVTIIAAPPGVAYGAGQTCKETHVRRFRKGMVATLIFDMRDGELQRMDCYWNKELTRKRVLAILPEYLAWRNEAYRLLGEKYGLGTQAIVDLRALNA